MEADAGTLPVPEVEVSSPKPEEEAYCAFLLCQFLTDQKSFDKVRPLPFTDTSHVAFASAFFVTKTSRGTRVQLRVATNALVPYMRTLNRRTLDVLAARVFFYFSLAHERAGELQGIRHTLLELHNTAVLNHDEFGQEVLLNLLLRNYLHYNLYDQAEKLRAQSQRPEATRSNQQHCRHLFYLGRIRAVQLEYTEAKECMVQASRKVRCLSGSYSRVR